MSRAARGLLLLVALAVGAVITTVLPIEAGEDTAAPFVRGGSIGTTVHTSYADMTLSDLHTAGYLDTPTQPSLVQPAGVFLIAYVDLRPTTEPVSFRSFYLVGRDGTVYFASQVSGCPTSVDAPTGVSTYAMVCFDMPPSALDGVHLRIARGDVLDQSIRRDEVADVDLGISGRAATQLAGSRTGLKVEPAGRSPIQQETITVRDGS